MAQHFRILIAFAILGVLSANGQGCGIVGHEESTIITLTEVPETTPGATVVERFDTYGVSATATIVHPYNKYLAAQRYSAAYEILTSDVFTTFVQTERSTLIQRASRFTCEDGSQRMYTFELTVIDENTEAPQFNGDNYEVTVDLNTIPEIIPTGINVSDSDLDVLNALVNVAVDDDRFAIVLGELWSDSAFSYEVDLSVVGDITEGTYHLTLTASDGVHETAAQLTVTVNDNSPVPTTTEAATTTRTSTTGAPTTTQRSTTTQAPTTTQRSTTTEEVPAPGCGFVGVAPGDIEIASQPSDWPAGVRLWTGTVFNVETSYTDNHPHNVYLRGSRAQDLYLLDTTNVFQNFLANEEEDTIRRTINLYCTDTTIVTYTFVVPVHQAIAKVDISKLAM